MLRNIIYIYIYIYIKYIRIHPFLKKGMYIDNRIYQSIVVALSRLIFSLHLLRERLSYFDNYVSKS